MNVSSCAPLRVSGRNVKYLSWEKHTNVRQFQIVSLPRSRTR